MAASDDRAVQPSKDCTVRGCGGTMPRREAAGLHTLEWPWRAIGCATGMPLTSR
jgi:hypothetical protein